MSDFAETTVPPVPADPWEGHPLRAEVERLRAELAAAREARDKSATAILALVRALWRYTSASGNWMLNEREYRGVPGFHAAAVADEALASAAFPEIAAALAARGDETR